MTNQSRNCSPINIEVCNYNIKELSQFRCRIITVSFYIAEFLIEDMALLITRFQQRFFSLERAIIIVHAQE